MKVTMMLRILRTDNTVAHEGRLDAECDMSPASIIKLAEQLRGRGLAAIEAQKGR